MAVSRSLSRHLTTIVKRKSIYLPFFTLLLLFPSFFFCSCESFFHFGHIGFRSGHPSSNLFSYPSSYSSGYVSTYPYGYLSSFPSNFGLVDCPVFRPLYYTIFHLIFILFLCLSLNPNPDGFELPCLTL